VIWGAKYEQTSHAVIRDEDARESVPPVLLEKKVFAGEIEVRLAIFSNFLPSGFLPLLLKFADRQGYFKPFAKHLSLPMKSVRYTPFQKLQVLIASLLVNCNCIKNINHKLKPYPQVAEPSRSETDSGTVNHKQVFKHL
jgi:hypothetical protein